MYFSNNFSFDDFEGQMQDLPEVSVADIVFDMESDCDEHEDGGISLEQEQRVSSSTEELATQPCYIVYHDNLLALCNMIKPKCRVKGCGEVAVPQLKKHGSSASIYWVS